VRPGTPAVTPAQGRAADRLRSPCPRCGQTQSTALPYCLDCGESLQVAVQEPVRGIRARVSIDVLVLCLCTLGILLLLFLSAH
jgi:hypothetical protein